MFWFKITRLERAAIKLGARRDLEMYLGGIYQWSWQDRCHFHFRPTGERNATSSIDWRLRHAGFPLVWNTLFQDKLETPRRWLMRQLSSALPSRTFWDHRRLGLEHYRYLKRHMPERLCSVCERRVDKWLIKKGYHVQA